MTDDGFEEVLEFVRGEMDPYIEGYTQSYLRRRVDSRLRRTGCDGYADYVELLKGDDEERRQLMDSFWINVTEFFRNPEVWESLYETVPEDEIVAASVGCADGRETYSLAALLDAKGVDATVVGLDVDEKAVEKAREGWYEDVDTERFGEMSFIEDPSDYVEEDDGGYRMTEAVREPTRFGEKNAMEASERYRFDLVLCRNLLIYVDADRQGNIFEGITGMLDDGGLLVLGKTESVPAEYKDRFSAVDRKLRMYRYERN